MTFIVQLDMWYTYSPVTFTYIILFGMIDARLYYTYVCTIRVTELKTRKRTEN